MYHVQCSECLEFNEPYCAIALSLSVFLETHFQLSQLCLGEEALKFRLCAHKCGLKLLSDILSVLAQRAKGFLS